MILASPLALAATSVAAVAASVLDPAGGVPQAVHMGCADEGFAPRRFVFLEMATSGRPDYVCSCGWMQTSPRAGGEELLRCATWSSKEARLRFSALVEQQPNALTLDMAAA